MNVFEVQINKHKRRFKEVSGPTTCQSGLLEPGLDWLRVSYLVDVRC